MKKETLSDGFYSKSIKIGGRSQESIFDGIGNLLKKPDNLLYNIDEYNGKQTERLKKL